MHDSWVWSLPPDLHLRRYPAPNCPKLAAAIPDGATGAIDNAAPGELVLLEHAPFCFNVAVHGCHPDAVGITSGEDLAASFPIRPTGATGARCSDGLPPSSPNPPIIVPLMPMTKKINMSCYVPTKQGAKNGTSVAVSASRFLLTFGCTYHGVQCKTLDHIIVRVDANVWPTAETQRGPPSCTTIMPLHDKTRRWSHHPKCQHHPVG